MLEMTDVASIGIVYTWFRLARTLGVRTEKRVESFISEQKLI